MISLFAVFLNFLKIGAFAFGGAYAVLPLVEEQMVTNTGWMTFKEFSDLVAIDELTPGPILINSATFIGMKLRGIPGAFIATIGCIIPGAIIALTLVKLYTKYKDIPFISEAMRILKCMSIALISSVLIKMMFSTVMPEGFSLNNADFVSLFMVVGSFYILRNYKINPLFVMLGCGSISMIVNLIFK